jgi:glucose-6-phosphate dehydrogenase assembly protein OpcA
MILMPCFLSFFLLPRGVHAAAEHHGAVPERHLPGVPAGQLWQAVQAPDPGAPRELAQHAAQVLVQADQP